MIRKLKSKTIAIVVGSILAERLKFVSMGLSKFTLIYEFYSINKVKYCPRSWQLEAQFTVAPFTRKSIVIDTFMF